MKKLQFGRSIRPNSYIVNHDTHFLLYSDLVGLFHEPPHNKTMACGLQFLLKYTKFAT